MSVPESSKLSGEGYGYVLGMLKPAPLGRVLIFAAMFPFHGLDTLFVDKLGLSGLGYEEGDEELGVF